MGGQRLRETGGPRGAVSRNEYTQDTLNRLVSEIQVLQTHRVLYGIPTRRVFKVGGKINIFFVIDS